MSRSSSSSIADCYKSLFVYKFDPQVYDIHDILIYLETLQNYCGHDLNNIPDTWLFGILREPKYSLYCKTLAERTSSPTWMDIRSILLDLFGTDQDSCYEQLSNLKQTSVEPVSTYLLKLEYTAKRFQHSISDELLLGWARTGLLSEYKSISMLYNGCNSYDDFIFYMKGEERKLKNRSKNYNIDFVEIQKIQKSFRNQIDKFEQRLNADAFPEDDDPKNPVTTGAETKHPVTTDADTKKQLTTDVDPKKLLTKDVDPKKLLTTDVGNVNKFPTCNYSSSQTVFIHLDCDCFAEQIWTRRKSSDLQRQDVPIVVVNLDGIILAVNYSARAKGITRTREGGRKYLEKLQKSMENLHVIEVDPKNDINDSLWEIEESDKILQVLLEFPWTTKVEFERPSNDEYVIDATSYIERLITSPDPQTKYDNALTETVKYASQATKAHPVDEYSGQPQIIFEEWQGTIHGMKIPSSQHDDKLIIGSIIAQQLLTSVLKSTGLYCSAGVGPNIMLAKMASKRNKPEGIAVISYHSFFRTSGRLSFQELPGYGGKTGEDILRAYCKKYGRSEFLIEDIWEMSLRGLVEFLKDLEIKDSDKTGMDLFRKAFGEDVSTVTGKIYSDSVTTSMSFGGYAKVNSFNDFQMKIRSLSLNFLDKLAYIRTFQKRTPTYVLVKADMTEVFGIVPQHTDNKLIWDEMVSADDIERFVNNYVQANILPFKGIAKIALTGSKIMNII